MSEKIAMVTGANRGLGLGCAEALAAKGFHVVLVGRKAADLEKITAGILSKGGKASFLLADVSKVDEIKKIKAEFEKKFQTLDILINNAGVFWETMDFTKPELMSAQLVDSDLLAKVFENNTLSAYRMIQAFLPMMKKKGSGKIVNVSSGMGQLAEMEGNWPAYRISKTALNAVTKIFAAEVKDTKIKINAVCPGWVKTDMGGPNATRNLDEGVNSILWPALIDDNGPSGGFFRDGKAIPW